MLLAGARLARGKPRPGLKIRPSGWIFRWINFAIVFARHRVFLHESGRAGLAQRDRKKLPRRLRKARGRAKQPKSSGARCRTSSPVSTQEVDRIRAEAKRDAEAEAVRLRALARHEAETIERAAQAEISAAQRAAQLELKAFAARLAIERAEALLASEITPEAQADSVPHLRGGTREERELNEAVARRYASALADVALEQIKADRVKADFTAFVDAFYSSADLRNFLETPAVGPEQKQKVIEKISPRRWTWTRRCAISSI